MPVAQKLQQWKSTEEAQNYHKENFRSDALRSGKFLPGYEGEKRIKAIFDAVPELSFVLDIGCGSGGMGFLLQRDKCCTVHGVDVVEDLVLKANGLGVHSRVAPAEDIPYGDKAFDVVIISEVLEHLYDPSLAINEALRVLVPGGLFLGSVPHPQGMRQQTRADFHCHMMTRQFLLKLFKPFDEVELHGIPFTKRYALEFGQNQKKAQWWFFKGKKPV